MVFDTAASVDAGDTFKGSAGSRSDNGGCSSRGDSCGSGSPRHLEDAQHVADAVAHCNGCVDTASLRLGYRSGDDVTNVGLRQKRGSTCAKAGAAPSAVPAELSAAGPLSPPP